MNLSKSRYTKGMQCPKMLWMDEHRRELFDETVYNQAVLATGNAVGDLAMGFFGEYVEVPFDARNFKGMAARTRELLAAKTPVICEATFTFSGNLCMVDILVREEETGDYHLIEVKSSTALRPIYLHDMAFQAFVLIESGVALHSISLMHLNNRYVRGAELDLKELFTLEDHTDEVMALLPEVGKNTLRLKRIASQEDEPDLPIGPYCKDPYACGYQGSCWRHVPPNSVFAVRRYPIEKAFVAYRRDIVTFDDALETGLFPEGGRQWRQVATEVCDLPPHIDQVAISAFLNTVRYPLYLLDFETIMPAVPPWKGTHPYQQIPFQYSLHILDSWDAEPGHREFLAHEGIDPRRELAERLLADIPQDACVMAYNKAFEQARLRELACAFPDLAEHLEALAENMIDLMVPFVQGACYLREMRGSFSIKQVLPALCPDDPELDYAALDLIHEGTAAASSFETLHLHAPADIARIRRALLAYCRLDTLAMVHILRRLHEYATKGTGQNLCSGSP